jgi:hypothetical protein
MDISPYLRKPLRSLQEVVETRRPRNPADAVLPTASDPGEEASVIEEPASCD